MIKTLGILLSVFLMNNSFAQSYHVHPGSKMLMCKAAGKVDGIVELFFQETDLEGQNCGYFKSTTAIYTCFNGALSGEESVISTSPTRYGVNKLSIRFNEQKGFSLVKAFECDWNHEENCIPGGEEVLAEEALDCQITKLKY